MYYLLAASFCLFLLILLDRFEKYLTDKDFKFMFKVICGLFVVLMLAACGKDGALFKRLEYNINGEWRQCSQVAQSGCGLDLRCRDELYQCVNDVEVRAR